MKDRFNLENRIAVVTGGNGLLGTEYVEALVEAGARVAVLDTASKLNERLQKKALGNDRPVELFTADVTDKKALDEALTRIEKRFGTPDILINNAAIDFDPGADAKENQSFEEYSLQSWNKVIEVNLTGTMLSCQVFGAAMARKGRGSIINMSSIYGLVAPDQRLYKYLKEKNGMPFIKPIAYTATKSAVVGITK